MNHTNIVINKIICPVVSEHMPSPSILSHFQHGANLAMCVPNICLFYFVIISQTLISRTWPSYWKSGIIPANKSILVTPHLSHYAVCSWRHHLAFLSLIQDTHIPTHPAIMEQLSSPVPICYSDCNLHLLLAFSLPEAVRHEDGPSYTTSHW